MAQMKTELEKGERRRRRRKRRRMRKRNRGLKEGGSRKQEGWEGFMWGGRRKK